MEATPTKTANLNENVVFHPAAAGKIASTPSYTRIVPDLTSRITANPEQCGGRPCVRGMRVRVSDVLDLFAAGLTGPEILQELPYLEPEDLQACLQYAAREINHPVLIAR